MIDDILDQYESLLNQKADLEKKCEQLSLEYIREFGDDIETLFSLKVEVVTLKKQIAFCVSKSYRNEAIYEYQLKRYVDAELIAYRARLEELIKANKEAKEDLETVTYEEERKIKKIYYRIAHLIHPDLHPEYADSEFIRELWEAAVDAYKRDDYHELSITYDRVLLQVGETGIVLEGIQEKIASVEKEIEEIKGNNPYQYKFILDDPEEVKSYHKELAQEITDYQEYKTKLEGDLASFEIIKGGQA